MAYYTVTLIAQCAVLIEAKSTEEATDIVLEKLGKGEIKKGNFDVRKVITDEIEKNDVKDYESFDCDINLIK